MLILAFSIVFLLISERVNFFSSAGDSKAKVVSLWAFSTPAQTMLQLKGQFETQNPDIRLDIQTVSWDDLQKKTLWAIAADSNVPDVVVGSSEWTGGLINSGGLDPLDDHIESSFFDRYFRSALDIYRFPEVRRDRPGWRGKNRQYGLPLDLDLQIVYYREDILRPVMESIDMKEFPDSWDGLLKLGRAVRAQLGMKSPHPYLLYLDPNDPVVLSMALLPSSGGRFLSAEMTHAVFDAPQAVSAFMFYHELLASESAIRWERNTMEEPIVLYKTGRTLANVAGPWYTKLLETKAPELAGKWRIAPFPRRLPGQPNCGLGGACMAIPYNARHKEAAVRLIRFMSTDEFALAYFRRVGSPPPQKTAWADPVFDSPHPYFGGQKMYQVLRQAIETARPLPMLPNSEIAREPVRWALREIAVLDADATRTLHRAAQWADRILLDEY